MSIISDVLKIRDQEESILAALRKGGPLHRDYLALVLDIPRTTVYERLITLTKRELVRRGSMPRNSRGRPKVIWMVNEE